MRCTYLICPCTPAVTDHDFYACPCYAFKNAYCALKHSPKF